MRKKYEEYLAKNMLIKYFPERYSDLIKNEKPDLQSKKYGVEVTMLVNKKDMENRNVNKAISQYFKLNKFLYNIETNNDAYYTTNELIKERIKTKLNKKNNKNNKYTFKEINCLFLFNCNNTIYNHNKNELLNIFLELSSQEDKKHEFSIIYYYELGRLFEIDIINKTLKQIIIGSIELQEIIRITDLEFNK